jgi:hypothetical protein
MPASLLLQVCDPFAAFVVLGAMTRDHGEYAE